MLQEVEAPGVGAPDKLQIQRGPLRTVPPSHRTRGSRSTSTSVPHAIGKGSRLPRPSCARTFGCTFAQARTVSLPAFRHVC